MGIARREPFPTDPTLAYRDLARHMRFLLDRAGLTPRQLAAESDFPYSLPMLYRFFCGHSLPPPLLVEIVARRCGDRDALQLAYDRARRATAAASGRRFGKRAPRHARVKKKAATPARWHPQHAHPGHAPGPEPGPAPFPTPLSAPIPVPWPAPGPARIPARFPGQLPTPISAPGSAPGPQAIPAPIPPPITTPIPAPGSPTWPAEIPAPIPALGSAPGHEPRSRPRHRPRSRSRSAARPVRSARPARRRPLTVGMGFSALGALLLVGTAAGGTGGFRGIGGFDGFDGLGAFGVGKSPSSAHGRANGPSGRGSRPPAPSILSAPQAPPLAPPPVPPPSAATPPEEKSPGTEAPRQPAPDGNLIRNGYFAETTKPWLSEGEVWLRTDRDRLRISVDADEGGEAWDRRVLQRFAALRDDRRYTLKFAAAADSDITIRVVVYRESDPLTPVFDEDVDLDRRMHRFTFSFGSYLTTGEPIVGFEVGGHDAEHTVWVDGVSLVERG